LTAAPAPTFSLPVPRLTRLWYSQGKRLAVLLVGLYKPKVTDLVALP
jgi:hypothetical protein